MGELIVMTLDGETLAVHPSCVTGHLAAGWRVAPEPEPAPKSKKSKE